MELKPESLSSARTALLNNWVHPPIPPTDSFAGSFVTGCVK
jgi:hypothetical protein